LCEPITRTHGRVARHQTEQVTEQLFAAGHTACTPGIEKVPFSSPPNPSLSVVARPASSMRACSDRVLFLIIFSFLVLTLSIH
jgi:hypothetical protein